MEDFREKRLPDHLLSMLRKKVIRKNVSRLFLITFLRMACPFTLIPAAGRQAILLFFLRWGKIISQYPAVQLRIPV